MSRAQEAWAWLLRRVLQDRRTVLSVVFLVGALLFVGAFLGEWKDAHREVETAFRADASEHFGTIKEEIWEAVNRAASVAHLFQAVGSVDRRQFREFGGLHLDRSTGLRALVWAPRIRGRAADRGAESFRVRYLETPAGSDERRVVGQELGDTPASLEALQRARDTGEPAMTARLQLLTGEKGVHVYWAIYRNGAPRSTVAERRANLRGFVAAVFEIDQLVESACALAPPKAIDLSLIDEGAPPGERELAYDPSSLKDPPRSWIGQRLVENRIRSGLRWTGPLDIGGRQWRATLTPTAGYVQARVSSEMWEALWMGLVLTSLIGGYLLLLMRRTEEVERLVASRTQELEEALVERTRAEEAARTQAAQLDAVRAVSLEVVREVDLSQVLNLVARQVGDLLRTGTSTVWLWDEAAQALLPRAWHGTEEWCREARLRLGEGVVGTVAARGQGLLINLYQTSLFALPQARITTVVAEPLLYREKLLGVLSVHSEAPARPFTDEDHQVLALFASQAAIAIHTAQLFDEVAAGREQARRLTQQVLSIQEEERRHLSRELHDEAGQALTTLTLNLRLIHAEVSADGASLRQRLQEASELAQATVERIRLLARGLRPPGLDTLGLNRSLKGLCQEVERRTGVAVRYAGDEVSPLPDAVAICLYRVLQEALTNVVKHARANQIRVALRRDVESVTLSVADNGDGFDPRSVRSTGNGNGARSLGLLGMRERLELVGGRLEIVSRNGQGTRLIARVAVMQAKSVA